MEKVKKLISLTILIILNFLIATSIINAAQYDQYEIYLIQVKFNNNEVRFDEVSKKFGFAPLEKNKRNDSQYLIELISFSGEILETGYFDIPLEISGEPPEGNENVEVDQILLQSVEHLIILPYHENGKELYLYDADKKQLDYKFIGYLSRMCGDGNCQDHESFEDCPSDCFASGEDDYCNQDEFDQDPDCLKQLKNTNEKLAKNEHPDICNSDGECSDQENAQNCPQDCLSKTTGMGKSLNIFVAIILVVAAGIIMFVLRRKKNNSTGLGK